MKFDSVLLDKLREAAHIAVFTGAGISAESGVPTFRDAQTGLWAKYRAEDLATPEAFMRDPVTVWKWYQWRRKLIAAVDPNPGHFALARLEREMEHVTVITQNVDGLHARAGSNDVIELHGNIWNNFCFVCGEPAPKDVEQADEPPRCAHCGERVRPGVVWFGESLPIGAWERAAALAQSADLFFCIGTSSLVEPAASLPRLAHAAGKTVVQINPQVTSHDEVAQHVLRGKAGEVLPHLFSAAWPDVVW